MVFHPLYGGERGIRSREQASVDTLRIFAKSDFKHDFGDGTPSRDKYTQDDLVRFKEIAQRYGISKVSAMVAGFNSVLENNPFNLLKSIIAPQIFPSSGDDDDYMDEDSALKKIGFNAGEIKILFKKEIEKANASNTLASAVLRIPDIPLNTPEGMRTYEVSGVLMKDKSGEGTLNVASRFENVTGGKTKFALIIDAATLATSAFINSDLDPLPNNQCEFYIIENIENDSDSATKLTVGGLDKPKIASNLAKKPNLFFMKDIQDTVVYPAFNTGIAEEDGEALFGNAKLVLSRSGDDTEADFTFADKSEYHIDSVSMNANVKNASLNVLASALSKDGKVVNKQLVTVGTDKTPFLFPYLKRVGDWCQALSLLDSSREYEIKDLERKKLNTITLGDIRKDANAVVALVTVDRILLGYALSLGLDVFFTTGTDLRLMIYYKNKETDIDPAVLSAKVEDYRSKYTASIEQLKGDNVPAILEEAKKKVKTEITDIGYIRSLRAVLYRISVLRTSYTQLKNKIDELGSEIVKTQDPKILYRLYFDSATIIRKILDDSAHNELQMKSFSTYPALVNDNATYSAFSGAPRAPSRNAIATLKTIIAKDMYDDAIQSKKVFDQYTLDIRPMFDQTTTPFRPEFKDLYAAFSGIKIAINYRIQLPDDAMQLGGGKENIAEALTALQQFEVTPLSKVQYNEALTAPAIYEGLPLVLMQGSYYRDDGGIPYSVVDKYIITQENIPIFESVASHLSDATPDELRVLTLRFLILYTDILMGQYEALSSNEAIIPVLKEDGTPAVDFGGKPLMQENDTNYFQHTRLTIEATNLRDIAAQLLNDNNYVQAFTSGMNNMRGSEKWDQDTIKLYISDGRIAIRNNDFTMVKARIVSADTTLKSIYSNNSIRRGVKRGRDGDGDQSPSKLQKTGGRTKRRSKSYRKKTRKH